MYTNVANVFISCLREKKTNNMNKKEVYATIPNTEYKH